MYNSSVDSCTASLRHRIRKMAHENVHVRILEIVSYLRELNPKAWFCDRAVRHEMNGH